MDDYIHRASQYNRNNSVTESFLVELIIDGLKEDVATTVMPQQPKTMEELRHIGSIAEMAVNKRAKNNSVDIMKRVEKCVVAAEGRLMESMVERLENTVSVIQSTVHNNREWISVPKPNATTKEHKPIPESNPADLLPAQTKPAVPAQTWWTSQIRGTKYPHPSPPAGRPEQRPLIQFSPPPTKPVFHGAKTTAARSTAASYQ